MAGIAQNKIRIRLKAYDHSAIETAAKDIVDTATRTGATVSGPVPLPTEKNVYAVIRSPFKDKDSREHFEVRTHKRLIDIHSPTPRTVDSLMRLDLPAGVDIEINDDVETVGGLMAQQLGVVPIPGAVVHVAGLRIEAEQTVGRRNRISSVLVTREHPPPVDDSDEDVTAPSKPLHGGGDPGQGCRYADLKDEPPSDDDDNGGDYTDFYAGLNHAHNVGTLFRGAENALQPNYMHLPVGYHGRASSVVVSGTPIQRPNGQILENNSSEVKQPILAPSRKLDFELELGCFVCANSDMGDVIRIEDAPDYLFGMVLLNDWSARDIQAWEYQPLGPVHSKNFGTTISPWVVLMDALEPFATHGIPSKTKPLPYLDEKKKDNHFDIDLKVNITTHEGKTTTVSETSSKNLLFSFPQMLAHHTIGGCPFNVGDLLGSGTISGRAENEKGCLLEMSGNGEKEIQLAGGEKRTYLADYDEVAISGVCGSEPGALVGFGECSGTLEPAAELKFS